MNKKNKIKFEFHYEYNIVASDEELLRTEYTYFSRKTGDSSIEYKDSIIITKRDIIIHGERTKKSSFVDCLKNTNNTLYQEIIRSVVFAYMTQGLLFNKGKCEIKLPEEILTEADFGTIKNICFNTLDRALLLSVSVCKAVFEDNKWAKALLISLSEFIVANNLNDPDVEIQLFEYWKAFNTLYNFYSKEKHPSTERTSEHKQLSQIADFIKSELDNSALSISEARTLEKQILNFKIKSCLLNKKQTKKTADEQLKFIKETIMSCKDTRLLVVIKEILDNNSEKFDFSTQSKVAIDNHIVTVIDNSDADLLCFAVVDYGYYLRCKFFHGEKSTPNFISNDNPETDEILTVISLLKKLLIDLYKELENCSVAAEEGNS